MHGNKLTLKLSPHGGPAASRLACSSPLKRLGIRKRCFSLAVRLNDWPNGEVESRRVMEVECNRGLKK
jgi:hypothetical protein